MKIWLVEILVRLGVAVIADGRCRPRWYGSDQEVVCGRVRVAWWRRRQVLGLSYGSGKLTPFKYYCMREIVSGSNLPHQQYRYGAGLAFAGRLKSC